MMEAVRYSECESAKVQTHAATYNMFQDIVSRIRYVLYGLAVIRSSENMIALVDHNECSVVEANAEEHYVPARTSIAAAMFPDSATKDSQSSQPRPDLR